MSIASRIKEAREQRRLSQTEFGRMLSRPRSHVAISEMESGQTRVDSAELPEIAALLNRPVEWFYGKEIEPPKSPQQIIEDFKAYAREVARRPYD